MSDISFILVIIGGFFTILQCGLIGMAIASLAGGARKSVNVNLWPGLIAVVLFIAAVLV